MGKVTLGSLEAGSSGSLVRIHPLTGEFLLSTDAAALRGAKGLTAALAVVGPEAVGVDRDRAERFGLREVEYAALAAKTYYRVIAGILAYSAGIRGVPKPGGKPGEYSETLKVALYNSGRHLLLRPALGTAGTLKEGGELPRAIQLMLGPLTPEERERLAGFADAAFGKAMAAAANKAGTAIGLAKAAMHLGEVEVNQTPVSEDESLAALETRAALIEPGAWVGEHLAVLQAEVSAETTEAKPEPKPEPKPVH